jgi:hypothetical protein
MDAIAEECIRPSELADELSRVGVEQQFVRIEAMAVLRLIGAVCPERVDGARVSVGQVAVPYLVGAFGQCVAFEFLSACRLEQAQLYSLRVRGEDREVHAQAVPARTQGVWVARQQSVW